MARKKSNMVAAGRSIFTQSDNTETVAASPTPPTSPAKPGSPKRSTRTFRILQETWLKIHEIQSTVLKKTKNKMSYGQILEEAIEDYWQKINQESETTQS